MLNGKGLFAGDSKASIKDLIGVANGQWHDHPGTGYKPSPAEVKATQCLLAEYMNSGGKGKGSLLDKIEGKRGGFSFDEMKNVVNNLPSAWRNFVHSSRVAECIRQSLKKFTRYSRHVGSFARHGKKFSLHGLRRTNAMVSGRVTVADAPP